jgi:hypothetical protein
MVGLLRVSRRIVGMTVNEILTRRSPDYSIRAAFDSPKGDQAGKGSIIDSWRGEFISQGCLVIAT